MARKKRTTTDIEQAAPAAVAVAEPEAPAAQEPLQAPAWIEGPPTTEDGQLDVQAARTTNWGDPYKRIFSSEAAGIEMGENRRFKQRVFKFKERPAPQVIDALKEHGFTYRPAEKAWTIPANPDTRRLSEELAQQFAGESPGMSRQ